MIKGEINMSDLNTLGYHPGTSSIHHLNATAKLVFFY